MTSPESLPWHLAAVIEVPFDDRVQCQCKGCGHPVYKQVHLIVWTDGRIECWGQVCYARELGATPQGRTAKPIYDLGGRHKLTQDERELLKGNREQLIARFREERQRKEQAEHKRQEPLRRAAKKRQHSVPLTAKPHEHQAAASQIEPNSDREGICEICGKKTNEWWCYYGKTGTCLCNDCKQQGKTEPEGQQ